MTLFFWFDLFFEARAEIQNHFSLFLVQMKTLKFAYEIYWPLMVLKVSIQCLVFGLFQNVLDLEFPKHPFRSLPGLIKSLNQYKAYCNSKKNFLIQNIKIISFWQLSFTADLFYSRRSFTASPVWCQSNGILKRTKFIILTWHLDPQFVVVSLLENSNFFGLSFMKTCLEKSEINKLY